MLKKGRAYRFPLFLRDEKKKGERVALTLPLRGQRSSDSHNFRQHYNLSHMPIPSGTMLGPYEVCDLLGAGGMGSVYRARDRRLDRDVALKVISDEIAQDPGMRSRFEREAKAIAALSHPNILSIFDFSNDRDVLYAVTELLRGETLRRRMDRGRVPWREAVDIAMAVSAGLAAAHERGVVHRDLEPENIFLISDGHLKILGFGLATLRKRASAAGQPGLRAAPAGQAGS